MSHELITPEVRAVVDHVPEGREVHIHFHPASATVAQEPKTETDEEILRHGGLWLTTKRFVIRPLGQVAKWGSFPIWGPLALLARDVVASPRRLLDAAKSPWQQEADWWRQQRADWTTISPEGRTQAEAEGRATGLAYFVLVTLQLLAPGPWKWIPFGALGSLMLASPGWSVGRWWCDLPQPGWAKWKTTVARVLEIL